MFNWLGAAASWLELFTLARGESWSFPVSSVIGAGSGGLALAAMTGLGWTALRARPLRRALPLTAERLAFAPLLGQLIFGLAMFAVATVSCRPGFIAEMTLGLAILGAPGLTGWARALAPGIRRIFTRGHSASEFWFVAAGVAIMLAVFVYALAPSVESDELRYHLSTPLNWLKRGRMQYIPWQAFSNFPFLGEMGFLSAMGVEMRLRPGAMVLSGGAKLTHAGFLPVTMALTSLLALRLARWMRGEGRYSVPAAKTGLTLAFLPMVAILAGWGFIDLFQACWTLGFVYLTLGGLSRPRRASAILMGMVCAGGAGVKYSMLPYLGGLGAAWFFALLIGRRSRPYALRLGFGTAAVTMILGGAWYVRNWLWTGNPFYPLARGVFGGGDWSEQSALVYMSHVHTKGMPMDGANWFARLAEFLSTPWNATFNFGYFESHIFGPLPLMALILLAGWLAIPGHGPGCLIRSGRWRDAGRPAWFAFVLFFSWVFWFLTYQSNRMLLGVLAMELAAAGAVWASWAGWQGRVLRRVCGALAALALALGVVMTGTILGSRPAPGAPAKVDALKTALGWREPTQYVSAQVDYARAALNFGRAMRVGWEPGALLVRTLIVGDHRTMHFPEPLDPVASDWFDTPQPLPWMRLSRDDNEMFDLMRAQGIEWIFLNARGFQAQQLGTRFTPDELKRLTGMWRNPRLELAENLSSTAVQIYRIKPRKP